MKLVIAPPPLSTGIPANERSAIRPMSPVTVTCFGERRTMPSAIVSIGTLRENSPETLVISVGTVVTESIVARLRSGPTSRTVVGVIESPPCRTCPESGVTLTSDTILTSLRATLSSTSVISLGRTSMTRTSAPLGSASSTSEGSRLIDHVDVVSVSGTRRVISPATHALRHICRQLTRSCGAGSRSSASATRR